MSWDYGVLMELRTVSDFEKLNRNQQVKMQLWIMAVFENLYSTPE